MVRRLLRHLCIEARPPLRVPAAHYHHLVISHYDIGNVIILLLLLLLLVLLVVLVVLLLLLLLLLFTQLLLSRCP